MQAFPTSESFLARFLVPPPVVRVRIDLTGTLGAVAAADRSIRLIDLSSGACVAPPPPEGGEAGYRSGSLQFPSTLWTRRARRRSRLRW